MRKKDCEMLLVLEMEGTAILTSGIIFTKSDKTVKKGTQSSTSFPPPLENFYFRFICSLNSECGTTISEVMWKLLFFLNCKWELQKKMRLSREFLHILELFLNDHCIAPKTINITYSYARHIYTRHTHTYKTHTHIHKYHEFLSTITHQAYLKAL